MNWPSKLNINGRAVGVAKRPELQPYVNQIVKTAWQTNLGVGTFRLFNDQRYVLCVSVDLEGGAVFIAEMVKFIRDFMTEEECRIAP